MGRNGRNRIMHKASPNRACHNRLFMMKISDTNEWFSGKRAKQ
ncbi:hypothetical protein JOE11_002721 [Robbsia andropogonis]